MDRTGDMRGLNLMCSFNETITELEVEEVQLSNRYYTWSGNRPMPRLSKLDRCFISTEWAVGFPLINLNALEILTSDHAPLVLSLRKPQHMRRERGEWSFSGFVIQK